MHAAGWVWRDCKPLNIIVSRTGTLQPLDFEGACRVDRPDPMLWGTPGFIPPEWQTAARQTGQADDLYALGSVLYLLATGSVPSSTNPISAEKLRLNIPEELCKLIMRLLSADPRRRPCAQKAAARLVRLRKRLNSSTSKQRELHRLSQAAVAAGSAS
jgi:serine/threonine protein kinase